MVNKRANCTSKFSLIYNLNSMLELIRLTVIIMQLLSLTAPQQPKNETTKITHPTEMKMTGDDQPSPRKSK